MKTKIFLQSEEPTGSIRQGCLAIPQTVNGTTPGPVSLSVTAMLCTEFSLFDIHGGIGTFDNHFRIGVAGLKF